MERTDILIVGAGIAGLSFAVRMAKRFPHFTITIITKGNVLDSNTRFAQGGIAAVMDETKDSYEQHIHDTLQAGDGLCNRLVVEKVVKEGPARLRELLEWGVEFDRAPNGDLMLGREGGHSVHRIIHYKDATGNQVAEALYRYLLDLNNVTFLEHHVAVDLITKQKSSSKDNVCCGVTMIDVLKEKVFSVFSRITYLATGGIGQVYNTTTNPLIATGDGIAMAHRAGAAVSDMEFVQFHPTAFYNKADNPSFLISEAVRGFGAYIRNEEGKRFVLDYDTRGELASRDIVSKAIYSEIITTNHTNVFIDCRHLSAEALRTQFPTIYEMCKTKGIDITCQLVPVVPAAHYICGGVSVLINGSTSIANLFACGECAHTGLHGANRLASNSLLEALVFSHAIAEAVSPIIDSIPLTVVSGVRDYEYTDNPAELTWIDEVRKVVRRAMSKNAGIVRSNAGLKHNLQQLKQLAEDVEELFSCVPISIPLCELRNLLSIAILITSQSLSRKENKGSFYNVDLALVEHG